MSKTCSYCGGVLELIDGKFKCPYCGAYENDNITEEQEILFQTAAQQLRMGHFDEAYDRYEDISKKYPDLADAYWGLVLSQYGIKYEQDFDGKYIPTCFATSYESLYSNPNYTKAINLANLDNQMYFGEQAHLIETIREEWLEKASKEEPYDIFISFKDRKPNSSDSESQKLCNENDRTLDSYEVYDLYNELTRKGYRVFFSRVSLKDKTGEAYEPYIFNALNTAKVMLVYASSVDYINSTWVKNEWSRFIKKIKNKEKDNNALCVIYKGFNPSLLPNALAKSQGLDRNSITFIQDLDNYLNNIFNKKIDLIPQPKKKVIVDKTHEHKYTETIIKASCINRGYTLHQCNCGDEYKDNFTPLQDHKYELVSKVEPTCVDSGKEVYKCSVCDEQKENVIPATGHTFGKYVVTTRPTCTVDGEETRQCSTCGFSEKHVVNKTGHNFSEWKLNKDIDKEERFCKNCGLSETRNKRPTKEYIKKKLIKLSIPVLAALVVFFVLLFTLFIPMGKYNKAIELANNGNYEEALEIFENLNYSNSSKQYQMIEASKSFKNGNYEEGIDYIYNAGGLVNVIYDANGGTTPQYTGNIKKLSYINNIAEKQGYQFCGWELGDYGIDYRNISADIILIASYEAIEYAITYNLNGGNFSDSSINNYCYDDYVIIPNPIKDGYTFLGWTGTGLTEPVKDLSFEKELGNRTFVANWEVDIYSINYNIIYNLNDGINNSDNPSTYNYHSDTIILLDPVKKGYTFIGWTTEEISEPTKNITINHNSLGDKSFTANWEANTYTITYDPNGGELSTLTQNVIYNSKFLLGTPSKIGYTFSGWYIDDVAFFSNVWNIDSDVTLVAKWNTLIYNIYYDSSYSCEFNHNNPDIYTCETETFTILEPTKVGYTFIGWEKKGTLEPIQKNITINKGTNENFLLWAIWEANTYTITFDVNGGDELESTTQEVAYDDNVELPIPTRSGYTFIGWDYLEENSNLGNNIECYYFLNDITVTARWNVINYSIEYELNNGINNNSNPSSYNYEIETITLLDPIRTGYTFIGWTYEGVSTPTKNITIPKNSTGDKEFAANWKANTYTITYDVNGGEQLLSNIQEVDYNSNYSLIESNRPGYIFDGWYMNDIKVEDGIWNINNDIKLVAKWVAKIKEYTEDGNNYINLGKYPQTIVSDISLINNLNKIYTTNSNGYYEYEGSEYAKYVSVPYRSDYTFSDGATILNNTTYWFKVEPIKWKVLENKDGTYTLLSEYLLQTIIYDEESNNYEESEIRSWLNNDFYNIAFSEEDKLFVQLTLIDNSDKTSAISQNIFSCENTIDYVYLLSYVDCTNNKYGFYNNASSDISRKAKVTDYALATGAGATESSKYGLWWTRSPGYNFSYYGTGVENDGNINIVLSVYKSYYCARPAITITLDNQQ